MPDLITHTLIVYPLKKKFPKNILFTLIGTILPDILGRIPGILFPNSDIIGNYQAVIHTPIALLLFIYSFSLFFPQKVRFIVFKFIFLGASIHLLLDMFQQTATFSYLWFFPFSFSWFQIPLIWPDETIYSIPFLLIINILLLGFLPNKNYDK